MKAKKEKDSKTEDMPIAVSPRGRRSSRLLRTANSVVLTKMKKRKASPTPPPPRATRRQKKSPKRASSSPKKKILPKKEDNDMKDDEDEVKEEQQSSSSSSSKSPKKKRKIQFGDVEAHEIEARTKTSGTSSAYTVLSSQATGGDSVFRRFDVTRAVQMREFLKENGLKFERGSTFCRVTSKPQILTRGRRVVMLSREDVGDDPDVFEDGAKCRQLLKITDDSKHEITSASAPNYEIYVSSSVPSKPLEEGTTFLYRVPEQLENIAPTVVHLPEIDTPKKIDKKEEAPVVDSDEKEADDDGKEQQHLNPEDMPVDSRTFLTNPDKKTFWELTLRGNAHVVTTGKIGPKPRSTLQVTPGSGKKTKQNTKKTPQKKQKKPDENVPQWPPAPLSPHTPLTNVKTMTHMCENADEAAFKAEQEIMKKQKEGFMTAIQVKRRRRERRIEKKIDESDSSARAEQRGVAAPSPTASAKKKVRFFETQLFKGKQFWHCRVLPTEIVIRSGRIGTEGKRIAHKCRNVHTATKKARSLIDHQKKAGYVSWADSVQG